MQNEDGDAAEEVVPRNGSSNDSFESFEDCLIMRVFHLKSKDEVMNEMMN